MIEKRREENTVEARIEAVFRGFSSLPKKVVKQLMGQWEHLQGNWERARMAIKTGLLKVANNLTWTDLKDANYTWQQLQGANYTWLRPELEMARTGETGGGRPSKPSKPATGRTRPSDPAGGTTKKPNLTAMEKCITRLGGGATATIKCEEISEMVQMEDVEDV